MCCSFCCRAIDFGTHEFCVPCETGSACTTSYTRMGHEYQRPCESASKTKEVKKEVKKPVNKATEKNSPTEKKKSTEKNKGRK